jgi:aspergillopepsin I
MLPKALLVVNLLTPFLAEAKILSVSFSAAKALRAPAEITTSTNVLTLIRRTSAKGYNAHSAAYLLGKIPTKTHSTTLISLSMGQEFATNITFGTETFESIVDTGSSDTWIIKTGFTCVNISNSAVLPKADCQFGPTYNVTDTFKQIPDENFNITYADGEFLTGIVGYENITLAEIKVRQEVPLVNYAAWDGDGTTSGLIGLAYPEM